MKGFVLIEVKETEIRLISQNVKLVLSFTPNSKGFIFGKKFQVF